MPTNRVPHRAVPGILLASLLLGASFAGCLGDDEPEPTSAGSRDALLPGGADATNATPSAMANATVDDGSGSFNETHAGHLPHVHDYWHGRERVILVDDRYRVGLLSGATWMSVWEEREPRLGGAFVLLPEGEIVYEGTGRMLITASWEDPLVTGLALRYKDASSREFDPAIPMTNGETLEIEVTPQMADMAHAQVSRWAFMLHGHGGAAGVAEGRVNLKIEIVKVRDIMMLPGHPETYVDTDRYDFMELEARTENADAAGWISAFVANDRERDEVTPNLGVVPMGTRTILVEVKVLDDAGGTFTSVSGIDLYFRTAASWWGAYRAQYMEEESTPKEKRYTFGILVEDHWVDGPYETESMWRFAAYPRERFDLQGIEFGCGGVCGTGNVQYEIRGIAFDHDPTDGKIRTIEQY